TATSISTARPVNTAAPKSKVNDSLPKTYSYFKAHSPIRRVFNQKEATKTNNFNEKVNTARVNNVTTAGSKAVVSATKGNGENAVKSLACWICRLTGNFIDHTSKDSGSYMLKRFDYDQGIFDSGCSRHMTGNKSFLTDYQEIDGGLVAFRGSTKGVIMLEIALTRNPQHENPVFHSKTKHIEIRHHFIRDSYEKRLIQVIKIHTDHNVVDLLTKAFDVSRDKFENNTGSCKVNAARQVGDEAAHKELGDRMERAATTASSLEVEHDSGNINRTQSMATLNEPSP
ncbi:hypothetical protein Tco_0332789, partial [Tanacetum coccineum]